MRRRFNIPALVAIPLCVYGVGLVLLLLWYSVNNVSSFAAPVPAPVSSLITPVSPTNTPIDFFIGYPAPDFTLTGLDGQAHRLQDYRGKYVILNFWATWCVPCKLETPLLEKTYVRLQTSGLVIIGIDQAEGVATTNDFAKQFNLTYPILLDSNLTATQSYGVVGIPTSYFVDPNGIVRAKQVGMLPDDSLQQYLNQLMLSSREPATLSR